MRSGSAANKELRTQSLTEDPSLYLQALKRRLQEKEGIPLQFQRLIFAAPEAVDLRAGQLASSRAGAEDLLVDLSSWQAILFRDNKAVARLVSPEIESVTAAEQLPCSAPAEQLWLPVDLISIRFDRWQLQAQKQGPTEPASQLSLACDATFHSSSYRLQVFGRSAGRSFAFPQHYEFEGQRVHTALSFHTQRSEYIQKQQHRHSLLTTSTAKDSRCAACSSALPSELAQEALLLELGEGVQQFAISIEPLTSPPVLKAVILRFVLVACSFLDEATAKPSQPTHREHSSNQRSAMSLHVTEPHEARAPRSQASDSPRRAESGVKSVPGSSADSPQHSKRRPARQSFLSEQHWSDQRPSYLPPGLTPANSSDSLSRSSKQGEPSSPGAASSPSAAASRLLRQRKDRKPHSVRSAAASLHSQDASSDAGSAGSWDGADAAQLHSGAVPRARIPGSKWNDTLRCPPSPTWSSGSASDGMQHAHAVSPAASPGAMRTSPGTSPSMRQYSAPQRSRLQHGSADSDRPLLLQPAENGHGPVKDSGSMARIKTMGQSGRDAAVQPPQSNGLAARRSRELNPALFPPEVQTSRVRDLKVSAAESPKSLSPHSAQLSSPAFSDRSQPYFSYLGRQRTVSSSTQASDEEAAQRGTSSPFLVCADSDGLPVLLKDGKVQGRAAAAAAAASSSRESRLGRPPQSLPLSHAARPPASTSNGQQGQRPHTPAAATPLHYDSQQLQPGAVRDTASRAAAGATAAGRAAAEAMRSSSLTGAPLSPSALPASQQLPWEAGALTSSSSGRVLGQSHAGPRSANAATATGEWLRQGQHLAQENFWRAATAHNASGPAQHAASALAGMPALLDGRSASGRGQHAPGSSVSTHQQMMAAAQASQASGSGLIHQHWQPPGRHTHSQLPSHLLQYTQHQPLPSELLAIYAQHPQLLSGLSGQGQYHPLAPLAAQQQQQQQPAYQPTGAALPVSGQLSGPLPAHGRASASQPTPISSTAADEALASRTDAPPVQPVASAPAPVPAARRAGKEAMPEPPAVRLVQPQMQPLTRNALLEPGPSVGMQALSDLPLDLAHQLLQCSDLERVTMATAPALMPGNATGQLRPWTVADIWQSYEAASSFGQSVYLRGGWRGPGITSFSPHLSALHLYVTPGSRHATPASRRKRALVPDGAGGWEQVEVLLEELCPGGHFTRPPLSSAVEELAANHRRAMQTPLCDLHPKSWFAVAWTFIASVPDCKGPTVIVTYHSLRPTRLASTHYGALPSQEDCTVLAESDAEAQAHAEARYADRCRQTMGESGDIYAHVAGPLILPVIGLLAAGLHPQFLDRAPAARQGSRWGPSVLGIPDASIWKGPWPKALLPHATHLQEVACALSLGEQLRLVGDNGNDRPSNLVHDDLRNLGRLLQFPKPKFAQEKSYLFV